MRVGRLPKFPTIEWYFHTTYDPSIQASGVDLDWADLLGCTGGMLFLRVGNWDGSSCGEAQQLDRWHGIHVRHTAAL